MSPSAHSHKKGHNNFLQKIFIAATDKVSLSDLEFPEIKNSLIYINYLSHIEAKMADLSAGVYNRRRIISCLEYLVVRIPSYKHSTAAQFLFHIYLC